MIFRAKTLKRLTLSGLPFADASSEGLPMAQLLRLSMFQVSVGMAMVLLLGTLNRVMIVEMGVAASVVAAMIALPVLVAPFRAFLGHRSDTHRSAIGWKRIPYLWFGSLWQMGGLAIMPFALILLSGDQMRGPAWAGEVMAAMAFVMTGVGMHMTQTAGLALASDRATDETRPRVVALLYVMYLVGMAVSAVILGLLLADFSNLRLVRVVQGCGVVTMILNVIALWKQEKIKPMSDAERAAPRPAFGDAWQDYLNGGQAGRLLMVVAIGGLSFNMQDVLLEPYGGEILKLSVSATTLLSMMTAVGALIGFVLAARWLTRRMDPYRTAGRGLLVGIAAFCAVILSGAVASTPLFFTGAFGIGLGGGLFSVATLTAAMTMPTAAGQGLALGAWGAAQATAAGLATALGGGLRDLVGNWAMAGGAGEALAYPAVGYVFVYHLEIGLLFATLIALGPLVKLRIFIPETQNGADTRIGIADFPT